MPIANARQPAPAFQAKRLAFSRSRFSSECLDGVLMSGTAGLIDKANRAWSVSASGGHSDSPAPTAKLATLGGNARWYVAQTLANPEPGAAVQLEWQGFVTFLPRMLKTVRHARRLRSICKAVFPGYVFVALDLTCDRWRAVNSTINVSRLVMGEDRPLPVPKAIVEALIDYRDASGPCRLDRDLQPGESVRVIAGPFAQVLGRIPGLDDKGRALWRSWAAPC
jgi:transcriptional antiterminator RfaH